MVKEKNEIYKCEICGNIVESIHAGGGTLVCCGKDMNLLEAKSTDNGMEKHVPVVEKTETGFKVKVGDIDHPMENDHFIEWIELVANGKSYRKYLKPGDAPEAEFLVEANEYTVREYCNLHGLWQTK
jgi:superoxide reductase